MTEDSLIDKLWYLYILRCRFGKLYTGITTDVSRRVAEHETGQGAKNLRGKGPLQLEFSAEVGSRSEASKLEARVKKLSRSDKESLLQGKLDLNHL